MTYRFSVPGIAGGNIGLQGAINDANNIPMPLLQAPQKTGLLGINQRLEGLATNPLFNIGMGMLGSQSPHFSDALSAGGRGLQQGVMLKEKMKDQSSNREYRNKMVELAKQRATQGSDASTNAIRNAQFLYPNDPIKQRQYMEQSLQGQTPSNIQEWNLFSQMTPEQQEQYLTMRRANRPFLNDVNEVPTLIQPSATGNTQPTQMPLSTQDSENAARQAAAAAQTRGAEQGKEHFANEIALPEIETKTSQAMDLLQRLKNHPGMPAVVGIPNPLQGGFGVGTLRGTPAKDFEVLLDQIKGGIFMDAYQTLKGGGQITEVEGQKAEAARARLNTAQTEEEFIAAVDEYMGILETGLERARNKVSPTSSDSQVAPSKVIQYDANGNRM